MLHNTRKVLRLTVILDIFSPIYKSPTRKTKIALKKKKKTKNRLAIKKKDIGDMTFCYYDIVTKIYFSGIFGFSHSSWFIAPQTLRILGLIRAIGGSFAIMFVLPENAAGGMGILIFTTISFHHNRVYVNKGDFGFHPRVCAPCQPK